MTARREMSHWTAGTEPGSEPKGSRAVPQKPAHARALSRASTPRCHPLRLCVPHWTTGSSPVVSRRKRQGRAPPPRLMPGPAPGIHAEVPPAPPVHAALDCRDGARQ